MVASGLPLCPAVRSWLADRTVSSGSAPASLCRASCDGFYSKVESGIRRAALGAGAEASLFPLLLLFFLQRLSQGRTSILSSPLELQWTVAQNLGTPDISSHPLFRVHCINHLHICTLWIFLLLNAQSRGRKGISSVWKKRSLLTAGSCLRCWSFPGVRLLQHHTELDCIFSFLAFSSPMPWIRLISGSWKSLCIMAHVRHFRTLVSGFYFWEAALLLRWVHFYLPVELFKLVR